MEKKTVKIIIKLISILIILGWMIKNYKFYLYSGGGIAFQNLLDLGITQEVAIPRAKSIGYLYLLFMYNGYQIPILGLIIVSIELLFKSNSQKRSKILSFSPFLFCLWGVIFLSFAFTLIKNINFLILFSNAFIIWIFIAIGYLIVFWTVKLIIYIINKNRH
ncbi:MAG: hypothetical protein KAT68_18150 [Bacteroidales bacterium]|nr:hypothetical protein [Bacteroidales bacterium]